MAKKSPAPAADDISDLIGDATPTNPVENIAGKIAGFVSVKKALPHALLPAYQSAGAACFDLHNATGFTRIQPGRAVTLRTGLMFELPPGKAMLIFSRSGHGFENDTRLANCVGVIDSDYRGEVMVRLTNEGSKHLDLEMDARIAQARIVDAPQWAFREVDTLTPTKRGTGGFGSTGA